MIYRRAAAAAGVMTVALVAACGSASAPTASGSPSVAPSTAAPVVGGATSPDPGRGVSLAGTFLERVNDPAARYRLDQTLTVTIGSNSSKAVSHTDADGAAMKIVSDSTVGGTTTHLEQFQADGAAYERRGSEDWRAVEPTEGQGALYPFLKVDHIRYAGRKIKAGEFLDALSLAKTITLGTAVAESLGVMGGSASIVVLDCYLHGDGSPVRIEVGFQIDAADGSTAGYGTIVQDFAEFGGDIVVEPPVS